MMILVCLSNLSLPELQMIANSKHCRTKKRNNYCGLLLHNDVRWLSRGKLISRFAACQSEIWTFLEMKNVEHSELNEKRRASE